MSKMKSNISNTFGAGSSQNVSPKDEKKRKVGLRPDGKKKKSMTNLINKVSRLVNIRQNSLIDNAIKADSSSDDDDYNSNNSDDSLME